MSSQLLARSVEVFSLKCKLHLILCGKLEVSYFRVRSPVEFHIIIREILPDETEQTSAFGD